MGIQGYKKTNLLGVLMTTLCLLALGACSSGGGSQSITFNLTAAGEFQGESVNTSGGGDALQLSQTLKACAFAVDGTVSLNNGTLLAQTNIPFIPPNGCADYGPEAGTRVVVFDDEAITVELDEGEGVEVCIQAVDLAEGVLESVRNFTGCRTFIPKNGEAMDLQTALVETEFRFLELACSNVFTYAPFFFQTLCGFTGEFLTTGKFQEGIPGIGGLDQAICELGQEAFQDFVTDLGGCPRCGNEIFDDSDIFGTPGTAEECEFGPGQDTCVEGRICGEEACQCFCEVNLDCSDAGSYVQSSVGLNCGEDPDLCCRMSEAIFFNEETMQSELGPLNEKVFCDPVSDCCVNTDTCGNGMVDFELGEQCDPKDFFNSLCDSFTECGKPATEDACQCPPGSTLCNFNGTCEEVEDPECEDCQVGDDDDDSTLVCEPPIGEECDELNPCPEGLFCGGGGKGGGTGVCKVQGCGNGILEAGEACEPGVQDCHPGDICHPCTCECVQNICGDGAVTGGENCDPPGSTAGCGAGEVCGEACRCVEGGPVECSLSRPVCNGDCPEGEQCLLSKTGDCTCITIIP